MKALGAPRLAEHALLVGAAAGLLVSHGRMMICDICGKRGARVRRTVRPFGTGRAIFLIEGVPLVRCPNCGESYFTAATLKEIERIRKHRRTLTVEERISVAKFKGAF